mgnify:CR=1 FL=1
MGYKIFVSYKHEDDSVYPLQNSLSLYSLFNKSTARDYVDKLESYFDYTNNIYKGERNGEDLSNFKDETIASHLRDKIYDSSVTIVLISPNMREPKSENDQWIPWEIAYSLRNKTRGDRTSHPNAILAVILPDRNYQYEYFRQPFSYQRYDGQWCSGRDTVFSIIRNNMNNRNDNWIYGNSFFLGKGIYPISTNNESYIPSVTWDDFIKQPMRYIEIAINRKDNIYNYNIYKEI